MNLLALLVLAAGASTPPDFDALLKESAAAGTPLVVDVFTTWCVPCERLRKNVFPDPGVVKALEGMRLVMYDAERGPGVEVARRFDVSTYPTVLLLTPDGVPVELLRAQDAGAFAAELLRLRALASTRLSGAETPASLYVGARAEPSPLKAIALFERAAAADPQDAQGIASKAAHEAMKLRVPLERARAEARLRADALKAWPLASTTVEDLRDLGRVVKRQQLEASIVAGARDAVVKAWSTSKDTNGLNSLIYLLVDEGDLPRARQLSARLEAIAPDDAGLLDTVAEVAFASGERERAITLSKRAISLATAAQRPTLEANLARFQKTEPHPVEAETAPDMEALFRRMTLDQMVLTSQLTDACPQPAGVEADVVVRVYVVGGQVKKATAFDPRAPAALLRCLEKAALKLDLRSQGEKPWTDLSVRVGAPPGH